MAHLSKIELEYFLSFFYFELLNEPFQKSFYKNIIDNSEIKDVIFSVFISSKSTYY